MTAVTFDFEQHRKELSLSGVFGIQVEWLTAGVLRPSPSTAFTTNTPQGARFICLMSLLPTLLADANTLCICVKFPFMYIYIRWIILGFMETVSLPLLHKNRFHMP